MGIARFRFLEIFMKKLFFSLRKTSALFVLMLFSVLLFGCKPVTEIQTETKIVILEKLTNDDPLVNDWYDTTVGRFLITKDYLSNQYLDLDGEFYDYDNDTYLWNKSYEGNNLYVLKLSETSGTIFIKYTRAADANWNYTTDPSQAPDIGKWYAVSYKDLNATNKTVNLSGAWKADGVTSCNTLEEAVNEFTIEKGYFEFYTAHIENPLE